MSLFGKNSVFSKPLGTSQTAATVTQAAGTVTGIVTNPITDQVKVTGQSVEKIAQGNVNEGLGDLGQGTMTNFQNASTFGNRDLVDQATNGLLTKEALAARGNTGDLTDFGIGALSYYNPTYASYADQILNPEKYIDQGTSSGGSASNFLDNAFSSPNASTNAFWLIVILIVVILLIIIIKKKG